MNPKFVICVLFIKYTLFAKSNHDTKNIIKVIIDNKYKNI